MAKLPFMPLATDAWLSDTAHLSDSEKGRYMALLIALWRAPEQRLPNDDKWLARWFKRSESRVQRELRPLIREFCRCDGNWITQKRVTREHAYVSTVALKRSEAAKSRWAKRNGACKWSALTPTQVSSSYKNSTDPAREETPSASAMRQHLAKLARQRRMP